MMNVHLYEARYFGGPCDGCVVIGTYQRTEETWSMSVSVAAQRRKSRGHGAGETCRAVYKLIRACHLIDLGMPTIRYEYEFVGYQVAAPATESATSSWLGFVRSRLQRLAHLKLWLPPLPEGRPKRPGQAAVRPLLCPGRGLGLSLSPLIVGMSTGEQGGTTRCVRGRRESRGEQ